MEYNKILNKIKKKYRSDMLLDMYLENYHGNYIYIRIDYYKKIKKYKLSWIDLLKYNNDFDAVISYEYIPSDMINYIKNILENINSNDLYNKECPDRYRVNIKSNIKNKYGNKLDIVFNRYINAKDKLLNDLLLVIFDNLPRKLTCFLDELLAAYLGKTFEYEYRDEFTFDLFNGDISTLFGKNIKANGEECYEKGRVFFLENINNEYYALVGGKGLYVIKIKYNLENKKIQVSCSCPSEMFCKHIYAVILAIRNNKFRKFYKLIRRKDNVSLLDRVMNFNFLLSIGIDDQGINYLVIEDNQLKLLPVINKKGSSDWEVLEDDQEETLSKRLNNILNK